MKDDDEQAGRKAIIKAAKQGRCRRIRSQALNVGEKDYLEDGFGPVRAP
jgi:hypothetical protein